MLLGCILSSVNKMPLVIQQQAWNGDIMKVSSSDRTRPGLLKLKLGGIMLWDRSSNWKLDVKIGFAIQAHFYRAEGRKGGWRVESGMGGAKLEQKWEEQNMKWEQRREGWLLEGVYLAGRAHATWPEGHIHMRKGTCQHSTETPCGPGGLQMEKGGSILFPLLSLPLHLYGHGVCLFGPVVISGKEDRMS